MRKRSELVVSGLGLGREGLWLVVGGDMCSYASLDRLWIGKSKWVGSSGVRSLGGWVGSWIFFLRYIIGSNLRENK